MGKAHGGKRQVDGPAMTSGQLKQIVPAGVNGSRDLIPSELRVGPMSRYLRNGSRHHQDRTYLRKRVRDRASRISTVEELNACFPRTLSREQS